MPTSIFESKTLVNVHVIVNANSIVQNIIKIKYGIIKHVNVNVKIIVHAKKIIVGILVHVFENSRYLQSILIN